jgi:hypothetical protein
MVTGLGRTADRSPQGERRCCIGGVYTPDGFDNQCGAAQRAPLVGLATPNPDGTIGLGLSIVTVPGGRAVHVDVRITLNTRGGSWSDSAGNSGPFLFTGQVMGRRGRHRRFRSQPSRPAAAERRNWRREQSYPRRSRTARSARRT